MVTKNWSKWEVWARFAPKDKRTFTKETANNLIWFYRNNKNIKFKVTKKTIYISRKK